MNHLEFQLILCGFISANRHKYIFRMFDAGMILLAL